MTHFIVEQLRFAKQSFIEGLEGLSAENAQSRLNNANCISWMVGHLAQFDQLLWLEYAQGKTEDESLAAFAYGEPASTPALAAVLPVWHAVNAEVEAYLSTLMDEQIGAPLMIDGRPSRENVGTLLLRQTWHYWYHLGEAQAIRQALGDEDLVQYVGRMGAEVMFRPN